MKSAIKFISLAALLIALITAAVFGYKRFEGNPKDVDEERIGASLRKAIALLEALPGLPALDPPATADAVPEQFGDVIEKRARIRQGDISSIRRDLPPVLRRFEAGEASEAEVMTIMSPAYAPHGKALPALDKWVAEEPDSHAALLTRGIVRYSLGWHWRGGDYIPYTPKENLAEMTRLHVLAADDFVLALSKSRYPVLAVGELIGIAMTHGWKEESKRLYLAGERLSPSSSLLFSSYKPVLYAEWGSGSVPAAKAFLRRAEDNGVSTEARSALIRHLMNIDGGYRFSIGKPGALPHAIEFSERYNTIDGWRWRANVELSLDLFEDSLRSLLHVAEKYPTSPDVMADIAWVLRKLNRPDEARQAMRRTADLGSDWAQGQIIADLVWERNGVKRDWDKLRKECETSAEMLNPWGQNCVAGLFFEGLAGYPRDRAKAIAFFELAARQGNERAQHDYGWMLIQGMNVKPDREKGLFYMRNSARHKFEPALQKLKQLGERTDNLEWKANPLEDRKRDLDRLLDRGTTWQSRF